MLADRGAAFGQLADPQRRPRFARAPQGARGRASPLARGGSAGAPQKRRRPPAAAQAGPDAGRPGADPVRPGARRRPRDPAARPGPGPAAAGLRRRGRGPVLLLDTNVISELMRPSPASAVIVFLRAQTL